MYMCVCVYNNTGQRIKENSRLKGSKEFINSECDETMSQKLCQRKTGKQKLNTEKTKMKQNMNLTHIFSHKSIIYKVILHNDNDRAKFVCLFKCLQEQMTQFNT